MKDLKCIFSKFSTWCFQPSAKSGKNLELSTEQINQCEVLAWSKVKDRKSYKIRFYPPWLLLRTLLISFFLSTVALFSLKEIKTATNSQEAELGSVSQIFKYLKRCKASLRSMRCLPNNKLNLKEAYRKNNHK